MRKPLIVQSVTDVITNSSSELFIVCKEDLLHYVEEYDEDDFDQFHIKKLTHNSIYAYEYTSWDLEESSQIKWEIILALLKISPEEALKEGLELEWEEYRYANGRTDRWLQAIDYNRRFWDDNLSPDESEKQRKEATKKFHRSWVKFCEKHKKEIEEKVIGKYIMEVEDHFERWCDFRDDIDRKGYLYHESHH